MTVHIENKNRSPSEGGFFTIFYAGHRVWQT